MKALISEKLRKLIMTASLNVPVYFRRWKTGLPIVTFALVAIFLLLRNSRGEGTPAMPIVTGSKPSVEIRQGNIVGREVEVGYPQVLEQFLGIPYAQPTGGENRFKAPIAVNTSTADFDASQFGERCPAPPRDQILQGEDCLNLNIWRPKKRDQKKKLPVLVYFHGGAFNSGYGHGRQISNLVAYSEEPMLGLSFSYRVGAFGFLPSKLAEKEGILNIGLKDQILLLEWVQENIRAFGGDPDMVTIMGSSAGAHSIGHHLLHQVDKAPPFARVIMESGAATARAIYHSRFPMHENQFQEFIEKLGLLHEPEKTLLASLRKLPTSEIKRASEAVWFKYDPSVRWPFQPVIDGPGGIIEMPPIEALKAGRFHKVPILTGYNTNEGAMFTPSHIEKSEHFIQFFRRLLPGLLPSDLEELDLLYPDPVEFPTSEYREKRKGLGAQFSRLEQAYGQFAYVAPVKQHAHFAAQGPAPVYLYHFAAESSVRGGADHGTQAPFATFNKEIREKSKKLMQISRAMHAYWTSFIITGDPNAIKGVSRPAWPEFDDKDGKIGKMVIFGEGNNENAGGKDGGAVVRTTESTFKMEECKFWSERTEKFEL